MSVLALGILLITGLFCILLISKRFSKRLNYCAICVAVTLTWILLLVASWFHIFESRAIIAILMGQTIVGVYYLFEKKVSAELLIFRLPVLATATYALYSLLTLTFYIDASLVLVILWIITGTLYTYRANPIIKDKVKALIECCGSW